MTHNKEYENMQGYVHENMCMIIVFEHFLKVFYTTLHLQQFALPCYTVITSKWPQVPPGE